MDRCQRYEPCPRRPDPSVPAVLKEGRLPRLVENLSAALCAVQYPASDFRGDALGASDVGCEFEYLSELLAPAHQGFIDPGIDGLARTGVDVDIVLASAFDQHENARCRLETPSVRTARLPPTSCRCRTGR